MYVWNAQRRLTRLKSRGRRQGDGCLLWTGPTNKGGYVQVSWRGKMVYLHVLVYELAHGPVPEGKEVDHTCRRRDCFEETHLEAVTHYENMMRGNTLVAINTAKTHCPRGHALTEDNIYRWEQRPHKRQCLTCMREAGRRNWRKNHPLKGVACALPA